MKKFHYLEKSIAVLLAMLSFQLILSAQETRDIVHGNLIQFNDNGLWCWYQDERAIIDTTNDKLILGSDASQSGVGFSSRDGNIEAVVYDIHSNIPTMYFLADMGCDDHNAPGFELRPDGKYIALYSAHYDYYQNRYKVFDGSDWTPERGYDWTQREGGTNYTIAYNNVYYLSDEGRMYDFTRANNRSPNFIVSDDMGETWTFGGQLTTNTSNSYNKGYYKYWSNGKDRIDFLFTEQHPRDTLTSIYHGYIQGGKAYDSYGNIADDDIFDETYIPAFWDFTLVFQNGTTIGEDTFYRCWNSDVVRYDNGEIAAIITARENQSYSPGYPDNSINPQHGFIYARFNGAAWSYTYLGKAGFKFYASEADYVGLGALDPNDPSTIYISTPYDPRDTTELGAREIFKGLTNDNGASWSWTPVTENSTRDNMRPIVPKWEKDNIALLWCRGTYISAQSFDAAIVGIIEKENDNNGDKNYLDADSTNTTSADGSALIATGPSDAEGETDDLWHIRTGVGNSGNVFTSAEMAPSGRNYNGENAPTLRTHIDLPDGITYDIWVNFWADPEADWRVQAGLSEDNMRIFRSMASQQVDPDDYDIAPVTTTGDNAALYQAYLGRVTGMRSIDVFIDDYAYTVSSPTPTLVGSSNRTWYDGISYAPIQDGTVEIENESEFPSDFILSQNYPNPFNPTTKINYSLPHGGFVELKIYDIVGQEVKTLVGEYMKAGNHEITFNARGIPSGVYFYKMTFGNRSIVNKMLLLK